MTDEELDQQLARDLSRDLAPPERAPDLAFVAMTERLVAHERILARQRRAVSRRGVADAAAAGAWAAGLGLCALWRPEWAHTAGAVLPLLTALGVVAWMLGHDWGGDAASSGQSPPKSS